MHAPLMERLITTLAEVRALFAGTIGNVRRRMDNAFKDHPEEREDPVLAMLASAPVDDEPVTDDDLRHIEEGWQAYREGRVVTLEEVKQRCLDAGGDADHRETDRTVAV